MSQQDTYYRAFLGYRKETSSNRDCDIAARSFAAVGSSQDKLNVIRNVCHIDEEWIEEIEKGLVFVEKALKEERQFIQSNGEVTVIEKVKNVSKESIVHLAQHSNLITREQEGDDIVPDALYTVEKLNDYAVYENKFLYLLLQYLQDFVSIRYNEILSLTNRYEGTLDIDRTVSARGRTLAFKMMLHDTIEDDVFMREHNPCESVLGRIDLILKAVASFLSNPIMECCAKVSMIRPPITKTNVLKMDYNFKGAVHLYEYIVAYNQPGYTIETRENTITSFRDELGMSVAEIGLLPAFITYEYGLNIEPDLKNEYESEEERRTAEKIRKKQEQLEKLKLRLTYAEIDPAVYILELEKQNNILENQAMKVIPLKNKTVKLEQIIQNQRHEIVDLKKQAADLETELENTVIAYEKKIEDTVAAFTQEKVALAIEYESKLAAQKAEYEQKIAALTDAHSKYVMCLLDAHEREKDELTAMYEEKLQKCKEEKDILEVNLLQQIHTVQTEADIKIRAVSQQLEQEKSLRDEQALSLSETEEKKRVAEAQVIALRSIQGLIGQEETFTTETAFDELEKEYEAFRQFYQEKWKESKKAIRRSLLTWGNFKKKNKLSDAEMDKPNDVVNERIEDGYDEKRGFDAIENP